MATSVPLMHYLRLDWARIRIQAPERRVRHYQRGGGARAWWQALFDGHNC